MKLINRTLPALLIAAGIFFLGVFIKAGIDNFSNRDRVITVRGHEEKEVMANKPRKTITTEMTPDRIGRLMNISNIRLTYYFRLHQTTLIVYGLFRHPQSQA